MGFDTSKFETASFEARTSVIEVPELKQWFEDDDKPEWKVRCLTAEELAITNEAVLTNRNMEGVINAITSQLKSDKVEAVKEMIGLQSDSVPSDLVRRYSMLSFGSVEPTCSHSMAVKLGNTYPTTLYKLTNKIIELTGEGQVGK